MHTAQICTHMAIALNQTIRPSIYLSIHVCAYLSMPCCRCYLIVVMAANSEETLLNATYHADKHFSIHTVSSTYLSGGLRPVPREIIRPAKPYEKLA